MAKRRIALLLTVGMLLSLPACGFRKTAELPEEQATEIPAEQEAEIAFSGENQAEAAEASVPAAEETPTPTPEPSPTPEPLPPLPEIDLDSFQFLLANSYNSIGMEYVPQYSSFEGQGIELRIADAAAAFLGAAREAGYSVWVSTAYRNSEFLNNYYLSRFHNVYHDDAVETANHILGQGTDEHQTGLAIDFTEYMYRSASYEIFDDEEMADSEVLVWLKEHCAEYGFIFRYPEGKEEYYGVKCRHPAHFRYVGEEAARYITDNDLCLEEFLLMYEGNQVYMPKP